MDLMLNNKTALITGGAGGLGGAIARGLRAEGVHLIILDMKPEEEARRILSDLGDFDYIQADLSNLDQTQTALGSALEMCKEVDILVNCAGLWPTNFVKDTPVDEWLITLNINLNSAFVLSRDFVNHRLSLEKTGVILNITSQAAFGGATSGHAHYAAAKAALVNFTRSLAREVAPSGIRVNALAPGMMATDMSAQALAERQEEYEDRIPLGRIASCDEIADVAVFLCSPRAGYMTGATVDVSGGMLMH